MFLYFLHSCVHLLSGTVGLKQNKNLCHAGGVVFKFPVGLEWTEEESGNWDMERLMKLKLCTKNTSQHDTHKSKPHRLSLAPGSPADWYNTSSTFNHQTGDNALCHWALHSLPAHPAGFLHDLHCLACVCERYQKWSTFVLKVLTLLCQDHVDLPKHSFKMGMKLEMVSPWEQLKICPVSVTKVSQPENVRKQWKNKNMYRPDSSSQHSSAAFINAASDFFQEGGLALQAHPGSLVFDQWLRGGFSSEWSFLGILFLCSNNPHVGLSSHYLVHFS